MRDVIHQKSIATDIISHTIAQGTIFFIFGMLSLAVKESYTVPIVVFKVYAGLAFFLSAIFWVATCSEKVDSYIENFLRNRPTSALKYLWYAFVSLYGVIYLAAFCIVFAIGLVSGVIPVEYSYLRTPLLIGGILWLVIIPFPNIRRWYRLHKSKRKRLTLNTSTSLKKSSPDDLDFFENDNPLDNPSLDRLGRRSFSQIVTKAITSRKDPSSIVIGIYGGWGEGKTTVMNFIKHELKDHSKVVCVRFDPWHFEDEKTMLRNFFQTLAEAIGTSIYTPREDIGKWLQQYMAIIAPVSLTLGAVQVSPGGIGRELGKVLNSASMNRLRERIEASFISGNNRIVIMIDDIDRLDNSEIQTIFKLIKLCADFPYTTYVVALDENRVASALKEIYSSENGEGGRSFIEKIIQLPLNLPKADTISLRKICFEGVDKALNEAEIQLTEENETAFGMHFINGLEIRVRTPRMAKRYAMDLSLSLPILKDEINTVDFMLIEGLRLFYPKIYDTIKHNPEVFLGSYLAGSTNSESGKQHCLAIIDKCITGLTEDETASAKNLLKVLFPRTESILSNVSYGEAWEKTWEDEQCVTSARYFPRFFSYCVPEGDISDQQIASLLQKMGAQNLSETASDWRKTITERNVEMLIHKLRTKEEKLDASTSGNLALALASIGDVFPNPNIPFSFTNPFHQAAILIAHLLKNLPPGKERLNLGEAILKEAEPISFAAECLIWMRTSDEKEKTEHIFSKSKERELEQIIVSRIRDIASDKLLYKHIPESAGSLLSIWSRFGSKDETDQYLTESFQSNPENVIEFLKCYLPTSWGLVSGLPSMRPLERHEYDSIAKIVNPDTIYETIKKLKGPELDKLELDHDYYFRREGVEMQFARLHHFVKNEREANKDSEE